MDEENFFAILLPVLDQPVAQTLALSKGGWEGWLQCELWYALNTADEPTEREVRYPRNTNTSTYCDLVIGHNQELWVELKAYGIYRGNEIIKKFGIDVQKLDFGAPVEAEKLAILVVPINIGEEIYNEITSRYTGIKDFVAANMYIFYLHF